MIWQVKFSCSNKPISRHRRDMIGSSVRNRFVSESNAAGTSGPRGCDPLAWSPRQRIARSQPDWKAPKTSQFQITAAPQKIVSYNVHRGLLTLELKVPF